MSFASGFAPSLRQTSVTLTLLFGASGAWAGSSAIGSSGPAVAAVVIRLPPAPAAAAQPRADADRDRQVMMLMLMEHVRQLGPLMRMTQ